MRQHCIWLIALCLSLSACRLTQTAQPASTTQPTAAVALPEASATAAARATPGKTTRPLVAPTRTPASIAAANYEQASCRFPLPEDTSPECGYLTVTEDRTNPGSRTIRLHVAVFKSTGSNPQPDPLVYLDGGPGGNPLETVQYVFKDWFNTIVADRDVIIVDQRGTGLSEPALDCIELRDAGYAMLDKDLEHEESEKQTLAATQACHDRLVGQGINLSAYTSAENAADLNDLRAALGYDEWNLYGISYGTRLALTALRDTPQGIRSVILDSTYPPQDSQADLPANAERAFNLLFDACAQDAGCNRAYPNLKQAFFETVERMQTDPVTVETTDPFTGKSYNVLLNGESLIGIVFEMLYQTSSIPELPNLIYDAYEDRSYDRLGYEGAFSLFADDLFSRGMYYSVQCSEEIPFNTRAELIAASDAHPDLRNVLGDDFIIDVCAAWNVRAASPQENEPVRSDIPVLILAGQFDPITPPQDGEETAKTLSRSFFFEFPGIGHGVSTAHPCPASMLRAFLDDPTARPDDACIARMPGVRFT